MMKKQGTSMRLYILNFIMVWLYAWACFALSAFSVCRNAMIDTGVLGITVSGAFAELGLHTGFIVWKCKVENCRKYKDVNRLEILESDVE